MPTGPRKIGAPSRPGCPSIANPHSEICNPQIPSKAGHGFGLRRHLDHPGDDRVSIPSKAGHGFGLTDYGTVPHIDFAFQSPQRRGMGSDGNNLDPLDLSLPFQSPQRRGMGSDDPDSNSITQPLPSFNPLKGGAWVRTNGEFVGGSVLGAFQSPQRRGMGSDLHGPTRQGRISPVSIPSKAGHGFGRHVPDPPVGASRRSVERVLG